MPVYQLPASYLLSVQHVAAVDSSSIYVIKLLVLANV